MLTHNKVRQIQVKTNAREMPALLLTHVERALKLAIGGQGRVINVRFDHKSGYVYAVITASAAQPPEWLAGFLTGVMYGVLVDNWVELR